MKQKTSYLIYLVLAVVLGVIWIWQIVEHRRVNHSARAALTGLRKKGHTIEKDNRDGATCYRIVEAS